MAKASLSGWELGKTAGSSPALVAMAFLSPNPGVQLDKLIHFHLYQIYFVYAVDGNEAVENYEFICYTAWERRQTESCI